jgi:UPF0755 protein
MKRLITLAIVLAVIVAGIFEWGYAVFTGPGPAAKSGKETVVIVKPGIGLRGIATALAEAGVISREDVFFAGVRLSGRTGALKAGEYAIPGRASMADILGILAAGKSIRHKLTIAEGLTSKMAIDLVKADPVLTGEAGAVPAEGSLLPETYLFQRGATRAEIVAEMKQAQDQLLDKLWAKRVPNPQIKSKQAALILASIVEKETALPAERRHIAAVFVNRLKIGMPLQSDPTIIYGLTGGYPLGRGIRKSEIEKRTPFNTYVIAALPPAPICNPGKDAIAAVLNPADSKDLYFVADGTGGHVFAATADEQAKNVANWRRIEKSRQNGTVRPD